MNFPIPKQQNLDAASLLQFRRPLSIQPVLRSSTAGGGWRGGTGGEGGEHGRPLPLPPLHPMARGNGGEARRLSNWFVAYSEARFQPADSAPRKFCQVSWLR